MPRPDEPTARVTPAQAPDIDDSLDGPDLREQVRELQARLQQSWPGKFAQRFFDYDVLALAAALSFYTLLSLAPLVLMLLWLTTTLYPSAQEEFFHQIGLLVGPQVEDTARLIVANAERQPGTGSFAALLGTGRKRPQRADDQQAADGEDDARGPVQERGHHLHLPAVDLHVG